ncbi:MAG: hypothetical protein LBC74_04930 [Planctomycetaceae bacterium]|jgi:hypothetical protein|nr:hypothetical protein [Planctomycetaceae bacterium]
MYYGDQSEMWDKMYEQGFLKIKKPTDQGEYPNPPYEAWNIPSHTWINPYFCWENKFCAGIDSNKLIRSQNELSNDLRAKICTIETLLDGSNKNKTKLDELCENNICCNVTIHMYCSPEFLDGLKQSMQYAIFLITDPKKKKSEKNFENDKFCGNSPNLYNFLKPTLTIQKNIENLDKHVQKIINVYCNKSAKFECEKTKRLRR